MKQMSRIFLVALPLGLWGCSGIGPGEDSPRSLETDFGLFYVSYQPLGGEVPFNESFSLDIQVYEGNDHAILVTDAEIFVDATMPAHGHGMNTVPQVFPYGDGTFRVDGLLFHMRGEWRLDVTVIEGSDFDIAHFVIQM